MSVTDGQFINLVAGLKECFLGRFASDARFALQQLAYEIAERQIHTKVHQDSSLCRKLRPIRTNTPPCPRCHVLVQQ